MHVPRNLLIALSAGLHPIFSCLCGGSLGTRFHACMHLLVSLLQGFAEDDVYLCESRYSYKPKVIKKIKVSCTGRHMQFTRP